MSTPTPPPKVCETCGRSITYRAKWARDWAQVRRCSERCRRARPSADDPLEQAILDLLNARPAGGGVSPAEVLAAQPPGALPTLEAVRQAARRLVHKGQAELWQGKAVVEPDAARGPFLLRRPRAGGGPRG
jgi:hypothetical protein